MRFSMIQHTDRPSSRSIRILCHLDVLAEVRSHLIAPDELETGEGNLVDSGKASRNGKCAGAILLIGSY